MRKYAFLVLLSSLSFAEQQAESPNFIDPYQVEQRGSSDPNSDSTDVEDPPFSHAFTSNVSLVSDYRWRGISQTMKEPAIQGGFDYVHTSGVYLGTWASNVDGTSNFYNNTSMEWDFYAGYKGKQIPHFVYNLGVLYYWYPGGQAQNAQNTSYNTAELYLEFLYRWFSVKGFYAVTNWFGYNSDNTPTNWDTGISSCPNGNSHGSWYLEGNASFDLMEKVRFGRFQAGALNLLLHAGHQKVRHYSQSSYTDWKVSLTQGFAWFSAFLTYVGTDANSAFYDVPDNAFDPKRRSLGAQGFVFGIIRNF